MTDTKQVKPRKTLSDDDKSRLEKMQQLSFADLAKAADEASAELAAVLTTRRLIGMAMSRKNRKTRA